MKKLLPKNLIKLASVCHIPLYIVGGAVRDHLAGYPLKDADWDLASAATDEEFCAAARACGFSVRAVYPATGTVKAEDPDGIGYEYTRFRSDKYVRGIHTPAEICLCAARWKPSVRFLRKTEPKKFFRRCNKISF